MDEIKGYIEKIIFLNEENGFIVAKLKENQKKDLTIIVGTMPSIKVGETILAKGIWKFHKKFGRQFEVKNFSTIAPSTILGIEKYLASGLVKGIGKVYAKKIVKKFGIETLDVIDQNPNLLLNVNGIGGKRVSIIKKYWKEQKSIRDVMIFLRSFDISPGYAQKIYKKYEENSISKVKENPYNLAKDIFGIGFKTADKIAEKLKFSKRSSKRIEAGILFCFSEIGNLGHSCFLEEGFIKKASSILDVEKDLIEEILLKMIEQKRVIKEKINNSFFLWSSLMFNIEKNISQELFRIKNSSSNLRQFDKTKAAIWAEKTCNIKLSKKQMEAVENGVSNKINIITGGPGTGKSTITKLILKIFEKLTKKIILAAPTGRAAKRMSEITRKKAFTIHSLLEFDFIKNNFKKNKNNPLNVDVIIIDESSMIDTFLIYFLLLAIPSHCIIIFVGDADQLPSVGPGNVLKDLIDSKIIKTTKLTDIFRQKKNSFIIINAHRINKAMFPIIKQKTDFHFIEIQEPDQIKDKIISLIKNEIFEKYNTSKIQVLTPMKRGIIGTENLNSEIQNAINPSSTPLFFRGKRFHINDKVMQIKNNYNKNVFNGDIGKIIKINLKEEELIISFNGRLISYKFIELDEIILAYAVSVHKYQGSEYPVIIMPIHTCHYILLFRNLLYTAITRSKKLLFLVGTKKAIFLAIKNNNPLKRYSGLKNFLINNVITNQKFIY